MDLFVNNKNKEREIFLFLFKKILKSDIMYKEDICMEINEILSIYKEYKNKVDDLWRSL